MGLFSQKDLLESLEKAERRIKREQKTKKKLINNKEKNRQNKIWC